MPLTMVLLRFFTSVMVTYAFGVAHIKANHLINEHNRYYTLICTLQLSSTLKMSNEKVARDTGIKYGIVLSEWHLFFDEAIRKMIRFLFIYLGFNAL
jgi:hypothetical protein